MVLKYPFICSLLGLSPSNLDELLVRMKHVEPRWHKLGTLLKLPPNFLDETKNNVDTNEKCLREVVSSWLSFHEPTMQKLNKALVQMNEATIYIDTL